MAKGKSKTGWLLKLMLILNIGVVIALLFSYLSCYVSPAKFWLPAFAGLIYFYLMLANLIFILFWLIFKIKFALISFIALLLGIPQFLSTYHFGKAGGYPDEPGAMKIISFNVRNFNLYQYKKNWELNFEKRDSILAFLKEENPDIICFQEFVNDRSGKFKTKDTLVKILRANNVHAEYSVVSRHINEFGIATFSAYPILHQGRIEFPNSTYNLGMYTDILKGTDTIRIYNAHFESIHFSLKDYKFAEEVMDGKSNDNEDLKGKSTRIIRTLKRAFVKRAVQIDLVEKHIHSCPYPVILCTDLNDTPVSYAYHTISHNLNDAFLKGGHGFGHTFTGMLPSFRIDYIFVSDHFQVYDFESINSTYSDHFPVRCLLKIKDK